ncbi:hypothetical protein NMT12_20039 [metagenome]
MKKIYYFESFPERKAWEKSVDARNGEIVKESFWQVSKKF